MSIEKLNLELNELKSERQAVSSALYRSKLHRHRDAIEAQQKQKLIAAYTREEPEKIINALKASFVKELSDFDSNEAMNEANVHKLDSKISSLEIKIANAKLATVDSRTLADLEDSRAKLANLEQQITSKRVERNQLDEIHNQVRIRGGAYYGSTAAYDLALSEAYKPIREVQLQLDRLNSELIQQKLETEKIQNAVNRKLVAAV